MRKTFPLFFLFLFTACSTKPLPADADKQIVSVYADATAERWLPLVYTCAERSHEWFVSRTPDIASANLVLRVNDSPELNATPYQIAEIEFVVVTNAKNMLSDLSLAEIQAIYTGKLYNWSELGGEDSPIDFWAYLPEMGLNETLLGGGRLSSLAKQAQNPRAMRANVAQNRFAIGFLPREDALADENIQIIVLEKEFRFPVLAAAKDDAAQLSPLLACLQHE